MFSDTSNETIQLLTCKGIFPHEFEKNLFKLINNAVYGETMENVREHVDVKLVINWEGRYGAEALLSKLTFHSRAV